MDFRIQSKSTGIPSPLTNNNNHNNNHHHHHQSIHNSSPKANSSPSYPEERDPRNNHHPLEDSSFTPSPTADHPHPNHHNHQQRSRSDPDPTHLPTAADQPPPPQTTLPSIRYRECQKNHAAHLGGHVVDGCGEFMPNGEDGTPESLRCAACDCHRNFHRKEVDGRNGSDSINLNAYKPINAAISKPLNVITTMAAAAASNAAASVQFHPSPLQQSPMSAINHHHHRMVSHHHVPTMMAFGGAGGGGGAESSSEDLNLYRPEEYAAGGSNSKKRYRTKFTQDQKDRMMGFAQKIGWRIQKQDDTEVQQFCSEVGVKRKVFKVWMHNNKQAMKRKES